MPTPFQESVWSALLLIPNGKVTTYRALSKYLGTNAIRAVGTAIGKNPKAPEIPCHRVVKAGGLIGNYSGSGGTEQKIELLKAEGVEVQKGRIVDFEKKLYLFSIPIP